MHGKNNTRPRRLHPRSLTSGAEESKKKKKEEELGLGRAAKADLSFAA
jgi:hypothetical protein